MWWMPVLILKQLRILLTSTASVWEESHLECNNEYTSSQCGRKKNALRCYNTWLTNAMGMKSFMHLQLCIYAFSTRNHPDAPVADRWMEIIHASYFEGMQHIITCCITWGWQTEVKILNEIQDQLFVFYNEILYSILSQPSYTWSICTREAHKYRHKKHYKTLV